MMAPATSWRTRVCSSSSPATEDLNVSCSNALNSGGRHVSWLVFERFALTVRKTERVFVDPVVLYAEKAVLASYAQRRFLKKSFIRRDGYRMQNDAAVVLMPKTVLPAVVPFGSEPCERAHWAVTPQRRVRAGHE